MASVYFALSSVADEEWLYARSLPNIFSIAGKSFDVCTAADRI
jgi:hypothetical protein